MKRAVLIICFILISPSQADAFLEKTDALIDTLDDVLQVQLGDGYFQSELNVLSDLEVYYIDQRAPGLVFGEKSFVNPRLTLNLNSRLGENLSGFLQTRFDRGLDPRSSKPDARLDQYFVRIQPFEKPWFHFQFGKFATVVGSFVRRHDSWTNPFINAPVPYENFTLASDKRLTLSPDAFLRRRLTEDFKDRWLPIIWGPSYTTGFSVFGLLDKFEYAFEIKNAALSSRPYNWSLNHTGFGNPTFSGRAGYRVNEALDFGASFSLGSYLTRDAQPLPPGKHPDNYYQVTIGQEVHYAWRHWEFWAESFWSRFEVPQAGNADTFAYYVEMKYKVLTGLYMALRWNQQFFSNMDVGGGSKRWDRNLLRLDSALGYRFSRHIQGKVQYSYSHQKGDLQQGENFFSTQLSMNF